MATRQSKTVAEDDDLAPGTEAGVKLPGGFEINTKGYHLGNLLQIVVAAILAVMATFLYDMRSDSKISTVTLTTNLEKQTAAIAVSVRAEHDKLFHEMEKHNEAQEEMNYILTLSPPDREKLRLRMPDTLRRKLSDR